MKKQFDFCNFDFSRIAIIGCPGSGKTTLSNKMGEILHRPVVHLDKVLWNPNWEMLPYEKRVEIHNGIIGDESWIIDGMWKSHLNERMERATLVVFLDYRRSLCMKRAVGRRIKYSGKQRDDIADGCLEKLDSYFLKYIWSFRKNVRPVILQHLQNAEFAVVTLKTPKQSKEFLQQLQQFENKRVLQE